MSSSWETGSLFFMKLSSNARTPKRGSDRAAGLDLFAAEDHCIPPGGRACVKTDIVVEIPPGCYGRIAGRSSLAVRAGVDVGGGVVDQDFRGPIGVVLFNHGSGDFLVKKNDRIAQLIIEKIVSAVPVEVDSLGTTDRGSGGFGSTGV